MRNYESYIVIDSKEPGLPDYLFRCVQKSTGRVIGSVDSLNHQPSHREIFLITHTKPSLLVYETIFSDNGHLDDSEREELPEGDDLVLCLDTRHLNQQGNPIFWGDVYGVTWAGKDLFAYVNFKEGFIPHYEVYHKGKSTLVPFTSVSLSDDRGPFSKKDCWLLGNIFNSKEELEEKAKLLELNITEWLEWPEWLEWLRRENG